MLRLLVTTSTLLTTFLSAMVEQSLQRFAIVRAVVGDGVLLLLLAPLATACLWLRRRLLLLAASLALATLTLACLALACLALACLTLATLALACLTLALPALSVLALRLFRLLPLTPSTLRRCLIPLLLIPLLLLPALLIALASLLAPLLARLLTALLTILLTILLATLLAILLATLLAILLVATGLLIRSLAIRLLVRLLLLLLAVVLLATVLLRLFLTLLLGRIWARGGRRRSIGIDLERPPFRPRDVRRLRPVVRSHGPIFEHAPRTGPLLGRHDRCIDLQHARLLAAKHLNLGPALAPLQPRLDRHSRDREIRVERPHPHGHRRVGRHPEHLLPRLLDRHFGSQVGRHVDPVLELLEHHFFAVARPRPSRHEAEPIRARSRPRAIGIEPQREAPRRPRQVVLADPQGHVLLAVAAEIDPGGVERPVALRDDRHAGALDAAQVALPGEGLRRPPRVFGIVVLHLPHQERRRIDHGHPQPITRCVASGDHELEPVVEAARRVGQDRHLPSLRVGHHGHSPGWRRRVESTVVADATHEHFGPFIAIEAAHPARQHELPATHDRDRSTDRSEWMRLPSRIRHGARVSPGELRRLDPHPRRRRD